MTSFNSKRFHDSMIFSEAIKHIGGLRFIAERLEIQSSAGRRMLPALPFLTQGKEIEKAMDEVEVTIQKMAEETLSPIFSLIATKLVQLRDIRATFRRIAAESVPNDVELFEVKHFAILAADIDILLKRAGVDFIRIPSVEKVIAILDPEGKRIPLFYIYDAYWPRLAEVRAAMSKTNDDPARLEVLRQEAELLEDQIRARLGGELQPKIEALEQAFNETVRLDLLMAKAALAQKLSLTKPTISEEKSTFEGLFHPQVKEQLEKYGKQFQPVAIDLPPQPVLITGANMTGKSVLLKSVALAQVMMQFGFFVPARTAQIVPVDDVVLCMGDEQDEMKGLSSFAGEMLRLNRVAERVNAGEQLLVLIDELARTTNPNEGMAIVSGMLDFLMEKRVRALVTTHYSLRTSCKKLRVKGFTTKSEEVFIDIKNINNYIDYSLEEVVDEQVPHEALRIAQIIGIRQELVDRFAAYLSEIPATATEAIGKSSINNR